MLPIIKLGSQAGARFKYSGIDSPEYCADPVHFGQWTLPIEYQYNSRGFRDQEWPEDLKSAVWCLGDSFTVGLGMPQDQTWPGLLESRTVNISLDGASNGWISRQACIVLEQLQPKVMVIHWSYSHRREKALESVLLPIWNEYYGAIRDPAWPDRADYRSVDQLPQHVQTALQQDARYNCWHSDFDIDLLRKLHYSETPTTVEQDLAYTQNCVDLLDQAATTTKIIHSFIPAWHAGPAQVHSTNTVLDPVVQSDLARDGYHYGPNTMQSLVAVIETVIRKS